MVYNWDGKEAECYRLYVEERKNLDEVIDYWEQRGFTPSKRAFQTQFRRWDFPSKQNPAHKNPALVARVKELWESNVMQRDMLDMLHCEGFGISDRELLRLRLRFKWLLRESKRKGLVVDGDTSTPRTGTETSDKDNDTRPNGPDEIVDEQMQSPSGQQIPEAGQDIQKGPSPETSTPTTVDTTPLDPEEALRRQIRQEQLRLESAEKWRTRKRRRRTRGWGGLPADAPGEPPRFPSETTLDESKAYLGLDNTLYREIRQQFHTICEEEGVMKKRTAGPEIWSQLKHRLVLENAHLSNVFQQDAEAAEQLSAMATPSNSKALSLDVICTDVTKRLRNMGTRIGIPEAKNVLGLNPEEARNVRSAFYTILTADRFPNKYEAGEEHWNAVKQAWIQGSELLTRILAPGDADPKHAEKIKAIDILAIDVMKRFRAEQNSKQPDKKKQVNNGPGPGPARPSGISHAPKTTRRDTHRTAATATNDSNESAPQDIPTFAPIPTPDLQIDPSLLLAASDPSMLPDPIQDTNIPLQPHHPHQNNTRQPHNHNQHPSNSDTLQQLTQPHLPLPIYFRLHPSSRTPFPHKTVWLGILKSGTVEEIRSLAMREHPGTTVLNLEGLVVHKTPGQPDQEVRVAIDEDEELGAYLQHIGSGSSNGGAGAGKATFVVVLGCAQHSVG